MKKTTAKQEKIVMTVTKRDIFGKKLKALRKQMILPANMYGEGIESTSVQLPLKEFMTVYKEAHETHIIYLDLEGKEYPVLIQHIQVHPVTEGLLHVDFRNLNLKKKIETEVPIKFIGESEAVHLNLGVLLNLKDTIKLEALPEDLPSEIEIDLSSLKVVDDEIKVSSIKPAGNYVITDEADEVIVRIAEHKEEDETPQIVAPENVEITGEKKETDEATEESSDKKEEEKSE